MQRADVLDTAKVLVTKERADQHGNMENNFATIAEYWSTHLGFQVLPTDVGVMMALLKMARIKSNPKNADNYVDGCGYLACAGEIAVRE
jgi:hypothetical protein